MDALLPRLREAFAGEAEDVGAELARDVRALESAPRDAREELYQRVARGLHTLKGAAATAGLDTLAALAHSLEDLLAPFKERLSQLEPLTSDALLEGVDTIVTQARGAVAGGLVDERAVDAARPGAKQASAQASTTRAATEQADGEGQWRVSARDVLTLVGELDRLRELRLRIEEKRGQLDALATELHDVPEAAEQYMALTRLTRSLELDSELLGDSITTSDDALRTMATQTLEGLFETLRRSARTLAREQDKLLREELIGADLAVERRVLEALRGGLLHLVRNAVIHGIESPAERLAAGKPPEALLSVRVTQSAQTLAFVIEDDGRGLDHARIRRAAEKMGLVSEGAGDMDADELERLVFTPGLSTAEHVTEGSGRGVGLDVVAAQVAALEGTLEVDSTPGNGTRFTLRVPIGFGSLPVLLVRVAEHRFALPAKAIAQVASLPADHARRIRDALRIRHDEEWVPGITLANVLQLSPAELPQPGDAVLFVQGEKALVAVTVDEIIGDALAVLRAMPPELRRLGAYDGLVTLAAGELVPVLSPDWLEHRAVEPSSAPEQSSRRALVVDDSLTARALLRTLLETAGYQVDTAANADQALTRLGNTSYEVVVADVQMARIDGYALTRTIRERPQTRALPVILVSARDGAADRARGLSAGADAYLSKSELLAGRLAAEVAAATARKSRS